MTQVRPSADKIATGIASGPSYHAIRYLIDHLRASGKAIRYTLKADPPIKEIIDEGGTAGHWVALPAPTGGFSEAQKARIEGYAQTLTYWRKLMLEIDWRERDVVIAFRAPSEAPAAEGEEQSFAERFREWMLDKGFKVARGIGRNLVGQGFKVREPVPATLVTSTHQVNGYALMLRYPFDRSDDHAGITEVYDRMVPLLADVFAHEAGMQSETLREADVTTVFVTRSKRYVSTLYEPRFDFRFITRRRTARGFFEDWFTLRATIRACRALRAKYKKGFTMFKPMPALGVRGHMLAMIYKKGAGGVVVDEAYILAVSRMTEKLMERFHLQASVRHRPENRMLQVTFYSGIDVDWNITSKAYLA
ncbi:MAG: hypothetical protein HY248_04930 [Fimbriimonas ginsengisoli]|uniref:Uncharacterized protein n=1 Tax=Fimbriimonas ginsengisoli TaxID=1005039 RepID=A0A931LS01_FIMGI|nr:hypothetical protein [Fimbriimonas ginsengisoli]MBI3721880.1 hypothetical protein [Fimbriimonas ginsengisoli]